MSPPSKKRILSRMVAFVGVCLFTLLPCWVDGFAFVPTECAARRAQSSAICASIADVTETTRDTASLDSKHQQTDSLLLIHWKGEDVEGYSRQLRHFEFFGALSAVLNNRTCVDMPAASISFTDALHYNHASVEMSELKIQSYNGAMQYMKVDRNVHIEEHDIVEAVERCSLVHAVYRVVAQEDSYGTLSDSAIQNGGFDDVMVGGDNQNATWCVRVRQYGAESTEEKAKRYGARSRSMTLERRALQALKPLLLKFGGKVNLLAPKVKIYIFDGLLAQKKVLARRLAEGPQVSVIDPNTRMCVTNTPLCPIAAFVACNVAQVNEQSTLLDPYAGSCATLLAAAMIAPSCRSVAIEIAHNGLVNRDDICKDFESRGLSNPLALLQGDSTDSHVRDEARRAIDNEAFDIIVTDPPYGIRESKNYNAEAPLVELFRSIAADREIGTPMLRVGGRLVAFVPCQEDEAIHNCLPTQDATVDAGLKLEGMREQPLNDKLSRWLVSYLCIR